MKLQFVYDDTIRVPDEVASLVGVSHFGNVRFRKRLLYEHARSLAVEAGRVATVHLVSGADRRSLESELADVSGQRYVYWPASTVAQDRDRAIHFLRHARHVEENLVLRDADGVRPLLAVLDAPTMRCFVARGLLLAASDFFEQPVARFAPVPNELACVDLTRYDAIVRFLSGGFDARFFNRLSGDEYTIVKQSSDCAKLRGEFAFYDLLPASLQSHFVRPFDYREAHGTASYRMERLAIPDMAMQWIHGALSEAEFEHFLDRMFQFLATRPTIRQPPEALRARADELYVHKVSARLAALETAPCFARIDAILTATGVGGVRGLVEDYRDLHARLTRNVGDDRCVSHGDLCFSNILYDKRLRLARFIDPRGARTEDELYLDRYYDVAKLSHSILGGYDYINNDAYEVQINENLEATLWMPDAGQAGRQRMFIERLPRHGFRYPLVRLYEMSLFLSMLPLHQDVPKKVLAFLLTVARIGRELRTLCDHRDAPPRLAA
ncbi:MAG: hypothetical protein HYX69_11245 [Planctomycetia bacterium]|nr:hypothetical protein [Planctomycetia bacterium]